MNRVHRDHVDQCKAMKCDQCRIIMFIDRWQGKLKILPVGAHKKTLSLPAQAIADTTWVMIQYMCIYIFISKRY